MKLRKFRGPTLRTASCLSGGLLAFAAGSFAADPVCFEAESAGRIAPPMEIVKAPGPSEADNKALAEASGRQYVRIEEGKGNPPKVTAGEAVCSFETDAPGTYFLWCRVWWADECSNSFTMSIDDQPPFSFGQDATFGCWQWVKAPPRLKQLDLPAGKHTLSIRNREDGVKIDQVLFTRNKQYVPVGIEDVTHE